MENENKSTPFGDTHLGIWIGMAIFFLAIALGIGGCISLATSHVDSTEQSND